ncbi:MAG: hypothetical protein HUU19_16300 [Phycisphaerales bacterium]|nr:hypothetical protein [Phycisphaerales bacterium]
MFEDFVREMTLEERAEAEGLIEKARAEVFPTLWTRVVHAVFAFGVLKATSLFCCFPSVGGALAFFGIRNVWVELALVAAAAVALGWAWRSVERDGRERAVEYLQQVIDDVAEGMVRETRWKADRVWRVNPRDNDYLAALFRIEGGGSKNNSSHATEHVFAELDASDHLDPDASAVRGVEVALRGVIVRLPRAGERLVRCCRFEEWTVARIFESSIREEGEVDQGRNEHPTLDSGDFEDRARVQVSADVQVEPHPPPAVDPLRPRLPQISVEWLKWVTAASVATFVGGFVIGLLLYRSVGDAIVFGTTTGGVVLGIGVVALAAVLLVYGAGQLVSRTRVFDKPDGQGEGASYWSESFDASRYELIRTREGGKIVAAAWYTQGLVYFARACVLDDSIKAGRCGRRMTLVLGPSGVVGVKHEGESIRCGSRVMTRAAFNRTFPERGAVTEAEAWGDEAAKATGSLA